MSRADRVLAAISATALLFAACGADDDPTSATTITIFAASSLIDAFEELGVAFEEEHPGVTVAFSFAGSSSLREQILAGAPADVFASANPSDMDAVIEAGAAASAQTFASNALQIAVASGNPAGIDALDDFGNGDPLIGLCAAEVPCGRYAREALANAGVTPAIDTDEPDVRSLLVKIAEGELDAGIVYATDVLASGDEVEGIDIPAAHNVTARYPITALADAAAPDVADAFVAFVLSAAGEELLARYGFLTD